MRKILSVILSLALLLSLSACSGKDESPAAVSETVVSAETSPENAAPSVISPPAEAESPAAPAAPLEGGQAMSWRLSDGTLTISGQGAMDDYELFSAPWDLSGESIDVSRLVVEEGISYLGSHAFAACMNLSEVTLPQSLRGIGSFCFADSLELQDITFNAGLLFIGDSAFSGTGLRSVTLPDGLAAIGELCFTLCGALTEVTLPDSLCSLGEGAFADCEALTSIRLGEGAAAEALLAAEGLSELVSYSGTAIPAEDYPWSGSCGSCSWALQHGVLTISGGPIPDFGTTGGTEAPWLSMAALITELRLGDDVSAIGDYAFWDCSALTGVTLSDGITRIGDYAFGACEKLEHFHFPAGLESIGSGAFSFCSALTEAELPAGLLSIGADAFQMCSSMQHMSIPESVSGIGDEALSFGGEEEADIDAPAGSYAAQWIRDNL